MLPSPQPLLEHLGHPQKSPCACLWLCSLPLHPRVTSVLLLCWHLPSLDMWILIFSHFCTSKRLAWCSTNVGQRGRSLLNYWSHFGSVRCYLQIASMSLGHQGLGGPPSWHLACRPASVTPAGPSAGAGPQGCSVFTCLSVLPSFFSHPFLWTAVGALPLESSLPW